MSNALPPTPPAVGTQLQRAWIGAQGDWPAAGTVLAFTSPVCAPCRAVKLRLQLALKHLGTTPAGAPDLVEVDVSRALAVGEAFGVARTPTVLLVDWCGVVVERLTLTVPPQAWWLQALAALGRPAAG
ncbi:hypothetical protein ABYF32_04250 [Buchananella felis]|uniref:hypothetical protein n=1 Tax=Buchananella felis TaxID=3231492 RepID=UPI003526E032